MRVATEEEAAEVRAEVEAWYFKNEQFDYCFASHCDAIGGVIEYKLNERGLTLFKQRVK